MIGPKLSLVLRCGGTEGIVVFELEAAVLL